MSFSDAISCVKSMFIFNLAELYNSVHLKRYFKMVSEKSGCFNEKKMLTGL